MIDISDNKVKYKVELDNFLKSLSEEYYFIKVSVERLLNSTVLLIEKHENKVIGVCGLGKWYGLHKSYFLFNKSFHGKGLGRKSSLLLNNITKEKYNIIIGVVDDENYGMLKVYLSTGYKKIGRRKAINYLAIPLNWKGYFIYKILKFVFPLLSILFAIVNKNKVWQPEI